MMMLLYISLNLVNIWKYSCTYIVGTPTFIVLMMRSNIHKIWLSISFMFKTMSNMYLFSDVYDD